MTYTAFVQDIENAQRVGAGYTGIFIVEDPAQPFFTAIVKEALQQLSDKKNGAALLQAIAQAGPADDRGDKILIQRVSISYDMAMQGTVKPSGGRSFASPAQKKQGVASDAAADGKGASAIVGWCQNQVMYTPKAGPDSGKAHFVPPPVTLGHELIHALHSLSGTRKSGRSIMIGKDSTSEEEAFTVGLGPYKKEKYTENRLRAEYGLPERLSYP